MIINNSLINDIKSVDWKPTLRLNLLRTVCAGLVFTIIALFSKEKPPLLAILMMPLFFPVIWLLGFLPFALIASIISKLIANDLVKTIAAGALVICAFMVMIGDPLMYALHKYKPRLLGVDSYKILYFKLVLCLQK